MTHLLKAGDTIGGRYRVLDFIGEGGMQEVYRARDLSLWRIVALKIPKTESAEKRFRRSAAMSAKVTHPNVAKTFDYLVDKDDRQILIEEFIPGRDLEYQLSNVFLSLDPHLAAHVLHHLAKGLAAVHAVGVTHRDLKPKNIMVSEDLDISDIKITDFGIAKMAEAEIAEAVKDNDATLASQTVLGAIPYMAPEVLQNRDDVSIAADIWSVGAMLYALVVGEPPYGTGLKAVAAILAATGPPNRPAAFPAAGQFRSLAGDLWAIVSKCLAIDPKARPTAQELVTSCNALCYSRELRQEGSVTDYRPKGHPWGFLRPKGAIDGVFFHRESYWGPTEPKTGTRVSFAAYQGDPVPRAHPVLMLRDIRHS